MNSIQFHSSFSSVFSHPQHNKQQFNTHNLLLHSNQEPASTSLPKLGQRMPYIKSRAAIITNSLFLAESVPVKGGDVSVLLPTGGLMLLVYFIANFVVPSFIVKGFETDEETEDSVNKNGGN